MKSKIGFSIIRTWQIMTLIGQAGIIAMLAFSAFVVFLVSGHTVEKLAWFYPVCFIWIATNSLFTMQLFVVEESDTKKALAQEYQNENKHKLIFKLLIIFYLLSVFLDITFFFAVKKVLGVNYGYLVLYFFPKILVPFVFKGFKKSY